MDWTAPIPLIAMWLLIVPVVLAGISIATAGKHRSHHHDDRPLRSDPPLHDASPAGGHRPSPTL